MAYIKKQPNGTYRFTIDAGRDPITNKRKQITRRGFKTMKEAKEALELVTIQIESGERTNDPDKMTVEDFFMMWLEMYAKTLSVTTYDNRVYVVKGRIVPGIGAHKLKDLSALHINRFYAALSEEYESSYVKSIHSILRTALKHAVKWDLLLKSPMEKVDPPKLKKKSKPTWSIDQVNLYFDSAKKQLDSNYYIAILNCAYTGTRRGEALGIRWSDINFEANHITIEQSVVYTKSVGVVIQGTKTESSTRQIELPSFLATELKWHKARQNEQRLKLGVGYHDNNLVACKANGEPLYPDYVLQKHEEHVKRCELPYIPIHGLRHTHATALLEAGIHPKIVQERLGHSSISITMDLYSHVTPNMQKEAVQKFDEAMRRKQ